MLSKTFLIKIVFVIGLLGVLTLAALTPNAAWAFFRNDGLVGFSSRGLERPAGVEIQGVIRNASPGLAQSAGVSEVSGISSSADISPTSAGLVDESFELV